MNKWVTPWSWVLFENVAVCQLLKRNPDFVQPCDVLSTARQWSLSWARWIHCAPNILFLVALSSIVRTHRIGDMRNTKGCIVAINYQLNKLRRNFQVCVCVFRVRMRGPLSAAGPESRGSLSVRSVPLSGRHGAIPCALLAAPVATPSAASVPCHLCRRRALLGQPDPSPPVEALLPRRGLGVGGGRVQCGGAHAEPRSAARGRRSAAVFGRHHLSHQCDTCRYVACRDGKHGYVACGGGKQVRGLYRREKVRGLYWRETRVGPT
jgi:hypothetical protein